MNILLTGSAGFIGYHLAQALLALGHNIVGVDNINAYYDQNLKYARLKQLDISAHLDGRHYSFIKADIADTDAMSAIFGTHQFDMVIHLAAQAGVRHSLERPMDYVQSNIVGFTNILEGCRNFGIKRLYYASSSSVYGGNTKLPFSESDPVDKPLQFYAATKRTNELMAYSYSNLFDIRTMGMRFFTVYGPWGRPDMALFQFAEAIIKGEPITIFGDGKQTRDFTYIDDAVHSVLQMIKADTGTAAGVINIGNGLPYTLNAYIEALEIAIGKVATRQHSSCQAGDARDTLADTTQYHALFGRTQITSLPLGISNFASWFLDWKRSH